MKCSYGINIFTSVKSIFATTNWHCSTLINNHLEVRFMKIHTKADLGFT